MKKTTDFINCVVWNKQAENLVNIKVKDLKYQYLVVYVLIISSRR